MSIDHLHSCAEFALKPKALASMEDPAFPNDYLLFSFSDNDFISKDGFGQGEAYVDPYAGKNGYSLDNQALVWRVTLE